MFSFFLLPAVGIVLLWWSKSYSALSSAERTFGDHPEVMCFQLLGLPCDWLYPEHERPIPTFFAARPSDLRLVLGFPPLNAHNSSPPRVLWSESSWTGHCVIPVSCTSPYARSVQAVESLRVGLPLASLGVDGLCESIPIGLDISVPSQR